MASLNNYYLRGPINQNDNVFIATQLQIGNYVDLYFLNFNSANRRYQFQPVGTGSPATFTLSGGSAVTDPIVFLDQNKFMTSGSIPNPSGEGTLTTLVDTDQPKGIAVAQTENINPWGLFLAGVFYRFDPVLNIIYFPPKGRQRTNQCLPAGMSSTSSTTTNFYVVPVKWYVPSAKCGFISRPTFALIDEIVWFYAQQCSSINPNQLKPLISGTTGEQNPDLKLKTGFTRKADCKVNLFYSYCPDQTLCSGSGITGCAGPCKNGQRDSNCSILNSQAFTCTASSENSGLNLTEILLIAGGIIFFIILLGFGVVLFFIFSRKKKSK